MIPETELVKYGLTGISFALIYLIGAILKQEAKSREEERKMYTNHVEHNTAIMQSVKDSTDANTKSTETNTAINRELTQAIRDLRTYLMSKK